VPFAENSAWQALAADAGFRQSVTTLGLQYTSKVEFDASGDVFGIDISSNRELTADVQAAVVDLKNAGLAVRVSAGGKGNSRQGLIPARNGRW